MGNGNGKAFLVRTITGGAAPKRLSLSWQGGSHPASRQCCHPRAGGGGLDAIAGKLDDDFVQAVNEKPPQQERPALDELFR